MMILKKATVKDIRTLNKISVESKSYWNYPKEWIEKWMEDLTLTEKDFLEQNIFLVEESNSITGYCAIKERESNYEITNLWVRPDCIGKGYGKYVLNETINHVVKKNKDIVVDADPNAEEFYQSQGFKTFDKVESFPKGRFLPVMKKSINK